MPKKKRRAPHKPTPPTLAPRKFLTREDILRTPSMPKDDPAASATLRRLSAEAWADLAAGNERLRWLNDATRRGHAPPPAPSAPVRRPRRKITEEIWAEHLRLHPLDKRGPDGRLLGAPQRTRLLKEDQGIVVDRSRVSVQLQKARSIPS